jgi:hypothetical protein
MLKWLKKARLIVAGYDAELRSIHRRIDDLDALVRDRTNIAVDVGFRSASHVIVIGRYKNNDYIQTFSVEHDDLTLLVDRLRQMERHGEVRRVDAPPPLRGAFARDLMRF